MDTKPMRVLLIEDNPGDTRLIREMLAEVEGTPFDLECAERLSDGLARLSASGIDAVLLDLSLLDAQGADTFAKAHAHAPYVPMIVLTGLEDETLGMQLVESGAQDYLVKGQVTVPILTRAIRYAIERKRGAEALHYERNKLVSILEAMEDGVYIVDQQYNIEYLNPTLLKEFGPNEGRKCYAHFHDRTEVCPWCPNQQVLAGKTVHWEWYSFKNQKTYDLLDTPLKNPDGSISKLEIFRDITERKRAEEALRKKDEHYRNVVESIFRFVPEGLLVFTENLILVKQNKAFEEITQQYAARLGYTEQELADLIAEQARSRLLSGDATEIHIPKKRR